MITVEGTMTGEIASIINTAIQYGRSAILIMDKTGNWEIRISGDDGTTITSDTETNIPDIPM